MSSLTHFLCCKVQVSLEQSERARPASSPSTTCISFYCSFQLPSDLIASFSFGLYLKLHQPYLLLSPPAGSDCRESPVLAYQSAESVLQSGLAPVSPRDAHPSWFLE